MAEIKLNINWDDLHQQIGKLVSSGAGMAAGAAGAAGGSGGANVAGALGRGLVGPAGARTETVGKGLGQIAKQLPGVGMFGDMAKAFTTGGLIGVGMAGIAGILSFVKQIMESSKVFQGIAGSFFKIFGAMADVFLLPFLPLAMRGMQALLKYLPNFGEWGQKASGAIDKVINIFQDKGFFGGIKQIVKNAWGFVKTKALPFLTDHVIPLLDSAAADITDRISQRLLGKITEPLKEGLERDKETWKSIFSENPFGAGAIMDVQDLNPWGEGYKRQKEIEERLGPQWRDKLKEDQVANEANQSMGEMQLGGLVSGIHQGGASGSISSGLNLELGNPLRNIRGKVKDVIAGTGEDIQQLRKNTDIFVDKSERDFTSISTTFIGGVRESMLLASSNISTLGNTVDQAVTQANIDITTLESNVNIAQQAVHQTIMNIGANFAKEIEALDDQATNSRNAILDKAIYFREIVATWTLPGGEEEGLSSAELRALSGKLKTRIGTQDKVEQAERERIAEEKRLEQERLEQERIEQERIERERLEAEAAAIQQAKDDEEARKAEEFRINTLKADPMFKSFEAMQNKLDSLRSRLASQEASSAGIRANMAHVKSPEVMDAWVGPLSDSRSAVYLQKMRRQQYWSGVVMPAQDAWQRHTETMSQTRQDIQNVENWIARKHIPDVYYNYRWRVFENQDNIASHQRSNLNYDAGGIIAGDIGEPQLIWAQGGEQISPIGMPKNNGGGNTSNRVLNISIETKSSVKEILIDLANLKTLDNASLFNSVW